MLLHNTGATNTTNPYAQTRDTSQNKSFWDMVTQSTATATTKTPPGLMMANLTDKPSVVIPRPNDQTTPQVIYVPQEVPAETPWLLILALAFVAYYMGKKR